MLDGNLTISQAQSSDQCNILYIDIQAIGCTGKDLNDIIDKHDGHVKISNLSNSIDNINPHNQQLSQPMDMSFLFYNHPTTINVECNDGYFGEFGILSCELNNKWTWIGDEISCSKVQCGDIPPSLLSPYHAHVYWQVYSDYNSKALVTCNSKQANYMAQLVCTKHGKWQWVNGTMPFRCPAWMPRKNKKLSLFATHLGWFIVLWCYVF